MAALKDIVQRARKEREGLWIGITCEYRDVGSFACMVPPPPLHTNMLLPTKLSNAARKKKVSTKRLLAMFLRKKEELFLQGKCFHSLAGIASKPLIYYASSQLFCLHVLRMLWHDYLMDNLSTRGGSCLKSPQLLRLWQRGVMQPAMSFLG